MNRRSFLRTATIATVAIAASPQQLISAAETPTRKREASGRMQLEFFPYELQMRHAFNLARSQRTVTPDVQCTVTLDGITGYGEASMPPYLGESVASVTEFLGKVNLSQFADPFRIEEIHDYLESLAPDNRAAKAAVDIALHDLIGKIMNQPWHRIWGFSAEKAPCTSFTIGIDKPEVVRRKVEEASPYRVLKVKMGLDNDQATINVIRSMTDVPLCVDVNQGWTDRRYALDMCQWLAEKGCLFVEQPFDKSAIDDTAWLTQHSPIPVIADEFLQRLPDVTRGAGAYSGINIKLMKSTGMHEAHQMATAARALGMKVMIGCMVETSCAVTAAAQLSPIADFADLDGNLLITNDRFSGLTISEGRIIIPDRPGIGVTPLDSPTNVTT